MKDVLSLMVVLIIAVLYFIVTYAIVSLGIKLLIALSWKQFLIMAITSLSLLLLFVFLLIKTTGK